MEFHLLYEGPLHSNSADNVRVEKHQIRKSFHRQLRRLWETHPNLRRMAGMTGAMAHSAQWAIEGGSGSPPVISPGESLKWGTRELSKRWNICGFNFLPLVISDFCLRCQLDVLFLRMEDKNWILQGGDVDGRIHVLFDALRKFRDGNDRPPGAAPDADEEPFFCLLQDDTLVSDVAINTGQLLMLPNKPEVNQHDVYLQITVKLNPTQPSQYGWVF